MKVLFENNKEGVSYQRLILESTNESLRIFSEDGFAKGHSMEGIKNSSLYIMNPKQLREYIGALLHIQSKFSKKGGNQNG